MITPQQMSELQGKFGDIAARIGGMRYINSLKSDIMEGFVNELLNIEDTRITLYIKPGLDTNAGVFFRGTAEGREYSRTITLLTAGLYALNHVEGNAWEELKEKGQSYKNMSISQLKSECETLVGLIEDVIKQNKADHEAILEDSRRKNEEKVKKAQINWGKVRGVNQRLKEEYRQYKRIGQVELERARQLTAHELLAENQGSRGDKRSEINALFIKQGIAISDKIAPEADRAGSAFDKAIAECNKKIQARHDFKRNLASNLFSAIKNYAPPPFNLIGTVGQAAMKAASKASKMYSDFGESMCSNQIGAKVWTDADAKLQNLKKDAEELVYSYATGLENKVNGDVGKSDFSSADQDLTKQFKDARERTFLELSEALTFCAYGRQDWAQLRAQLQPTQHAHSFADSASISKRLSPQAMKIEHAKNSAHLFNESKAKILQQTQHSLNQISVPDWNICEDTLGLNKYLILFLSGMYIHGEQIKPNGAESTNQIFKFEQPLCDLLRNLGFTHNSGDNAGVIVTGDTISVPYSRTMFRTEHSGDFTRLNCLLREYAHSDFTPFNIIMGNSSFKKADEFLKKTVTEIDEKINAIRKKRGGLRNNLYRELASGVTSNLLRQEPPTDSAKARKLLG